MSDGCDYYSAESGIAALLSSPKARFCESVDVAIKLGVNDAVRGVAALPKGLGRDIKVAVFAKGEYAKQALDAGADLVGDDDLLGEIKEGRKLDVDWCISTPDFMTQVSSVAKILGPKGLLPNPKFGTVTFDVARMVGVIKSGQVRIKSDRYGIVHAKIGNVGFSAEDLLENFRAVLATVQSLKPESTKGSYVKSVFMNTTMGKSFRISVAG